MKDAPVVIGILGGLGLLFLSTAAQGSGALSDGGGPVPPQVLQWATLAQKYAQVYTILDPEEILAIIWNESSGNPKASNPGDPSWGLMGVTPLIARAYGGYGLDNSWQTDGEKNIAIGSGFLSDLKEKLSVANPSDWFDAYNVGETQFAQGLRTAAYIANFDAHLAALKGSV